MTNSNAVKRPQPTNLATTEGFESQPVVAGNDPVSSATPNKVEELRDRIRAARLETMMARRLENELSIDPLALDPVMEPEPVSEAVVPVDPQPTLQTDTFRHTSRATESWTRSRFRTNRQECELMIQDLGEQANLLLSLADRSGNFLDYLEKVEQELDATRSAEIELREKTRNLQRAEKQRSENLALIDKQSRQIEMLESMRQSATDNYEAAKREMEALQLECDHKLSRFNEMEALASRLERENAMLSERFEVTHHNLEKANEVVTELREKTQDQDRELSRTRSEFDELTSESEQALNELSSLQVRYNELNKKSLENQGQHYARINELEEAVRELRNKLDIMTRERDDASKELEAANNLLMLHEEMICKLSTEQ